MKVRHKPIYAQEDCFDATERGCRVRISRRGHVVTWEVQLEDATICGECCLSDLFNAIYRARKSLGQL